MQEGPVKHHRLTFCMLISGAIAMRHGPQIILWLAGGMLVALIIVIPKFCLALMLSFDKITEFLRGLTELNLTSLQGSDSLPTTTTPQPPATKFITPALDTMLRRQVKRIKPGHV